MQMRRALTCTAVAAVTALLPFIAAPGARAQTFGGNELLAWSVSGAPSGGLTSLDFPITVNTGTAHVSGTYFAMQYGFTGQSDIGYAGLQPRPDANGHQRLRGVFSSFISGTTSTDSHCSDGADGGPGVSCGVEFDAVYGHTFRVEIAQVGTDTWSGTVVDTNNGQRTPVGTYELPAGSGNLKASQSGFIEYYDVPSCDRQQRYDVTFGAPSSGSLSGTTTWVKEYGDCLGDGDTQVTTVGAGVHVTRGTVG
ncbi:hypothetical protein VV02_12835 [Luteipulveratus mongoliensis]|uniref:Secreted protein n=1 Tax=Luteipulveratus mongoliensis TaxID=571913 RepID=A0A0K1JQM8_9MICO|nr:hypothetical protein VV02_12835 [Luteipulveratus mongoliensis]